MNFNPIVSYFLLFTVLFSSAFEQTRGATIVITSHSSSSVWWLAFSVSDPSVTGVELKDAGSYASWTPLTATSWGYWTLSTSGSAVVFPISFRLTAGSQQLTVPNAFASASPGVAYDTKLSFPSSGGGTQPTQVPTQTPTLVPNPPTVAPSPAATQKPTQPPATQPPVTQAPVTPAPTTRPTQPPATQSPATQSPVTPAPTTRPTQPATQAPTQPPATQAPTQRPTQPATQPPVTQAPTTPPSTQAPAQPLANPFANTAYYINPHYTLEVDSSVAEYPAKSAQLSKVKQFASAFWIDRMAVIDNVTTILTQARLQIASSGGKTVMAALVIYDLPARDCAALASNGEIPCADANCVDGINTYKTKYIDKIVAVLKNFPDLAIVTIIEPDSLPNLATNLGVPKCTIAQIAYKTCVAYAIQQLATLRNVYIYVDAAHGGWLGWDDGRSKAVATFASVLAAAGGASKIRGFATNVANYQPLGSMTDTADPCHLSGQYNFAYNEVRYVSLLDASLAAAGITNMHYIIDTGRNGVPAARTDCSNWCNINKAGLGVRPTSNTASSGLANLDAYFWVKPPGESDGTSNTAAPRYDAHCGSSDSVIPAPEAGNWFSKYFVMLVDNANPAL